MIDAQFRLASPGQAWTTDSLALLRKLLFKEQIMGLEAQALLSLQESEVGLCVGAGDEKAIEIASRFFGMIAKSVMTARSYTLIISAPSNLPLAGLSLESGIDEYFTNTEAKVFFPDCSIVADTLSVLWYQEHGRRESFRLQRNIQASKQQKAGIPDRLPSSNLKPLEIISIEAFLSLPLGRRFNKTSNLNSWSNPAITTLSLSSNLKSLRWKNVRVLTSNDRTIIKELVLNEIPNSSMDGTLPKSRYQSI